jgi:hypothetical protein
LRFIHNCIIMGMRWMWRWWVLVHCDHVMFKPNSSRLQHTTCDPKRTSANAGGWVGEVNKCSNLESGLRRLMIFWVLALPGGACTGCRSNKLLSCLWNPCACARPRAETI